MMENEWLSKAVDFIIKHFDAIITVGVTIVGFIVTYFMTRKNFKDEVMKNKLQLNADSMKELSYQIIQIMNFKIPDESKSLLTHEFSQILSKILAYGSKDAIVIAVHMQQLFYANATSKNKENFWKILVTYSLLITQIKYDLSSEIISPESWFKIKITDYENSKTEVKKIINSTINELKLNKKFRVKE